MRDNAQFRMSGGSLRNYYNPTDYVNRRGLISVRGAGAYCEFSGTADTGYLITSVTATADTRSGTVTGAIIAQENSTVNWYSGGWFNNQTIYGSEYSTGIVIENATVNYFATSPTQNVLQAAEFGTLNIHTPISNIYVLQFDGEDSTLINPLLRFYGVDLTFEEIDDNTGRVRGATFDGQPYSTLIDYNPGIHFRLEFVSVPEPSAMTLLLTGGLFGSSLLLRRRRKSVC